MGQVGTVFKSLGYQLSFPLRPPYAPIMQQASKQANRQAKFQKKNIVLSVTLGGDVPPVVSLDVCLEVHVDVLTSSDLN